jgi:hypothetical protein
VSIFVDLDIAVYVLAEKMTLGLSDTNFLSMTFEITGSTGRRNNPIETKEKVLFLFHRQDGIVRALFNSTEDLSEDITVFSEWLVISGTRSALADGVHSTLVQLETSLAKRLGAEFCRCKANFRFKPTVIPFKICTYDKNGRTAAIVW